MLKCNFQFWLKKQIFKNVNFMDVCRVFISSLIYYVVKVQSQLMNSIPEGGRDSVFYLKGIEVKICDHARSGILA